MPTNIIAEQIIRNVNSIDPYFIDITHSTIIDLDILTYFSNNHTSVLNENMLVKSQVYPLTLNYWYRLY